MGSRRSRSFRSRRRASSRPRSPPTIRSAPISAPIRPRSSGSTRRAAPPVTPSYIPLTSADLENWVTASARSYAASGVAAGQRIVTTYNAGPFVAGAALLAFDRIGLCHIPVGTGNSERLIGRSPRSSRRPWRCTPSYAAHLVEWAAERGFDLRGSSVERLLVAGEPGGGEPLFRAKLEEGWGAKVTEAMGIGDIGPSLWGECEEQDGMHLGARGFVHAELIEPETGTALALDDGATGELVLTHLRAARGAAPPLPDTRPRACQDRAPVRAAAPARACAASAGRTTCSSSAASTSSPRRCARSWAASHPRSAATCSSSPRRRG